MLEKCSSIEINLIFECRTFLKLINGLEMDEI